MASPFAVFRRNQKIMLAVVTLAAILAFVFLDPLMRSIGNSRGPENPVVVETKYGKLTQSELVALEQQRELVDRFLQTVAMRAVEAQIGKGGADARLFQQLADREYQTVRQILMRRSQAGPEAAAIETYVLARRAEEQGMVVSDQTVNDVLKQLTANSISRDELAGIIRSLQPSRPVSVAKFFDAIRLELLASKYGQMFEQTLADIPPAERFEYFSRLNRRVKLEALPLAVADFVNQVPDPSDEEVKKFYEEHKNTYPNADSPEPGFKQAKRATFQYFKADVDALTEKLKPSISEEEVKKYYDENKSQFRDFSLPEEKKEADPEVKEGEAKPEEPKADEKPDEGAKPAEDKPAEDKPAEEPKPAEAPQTEEKPAETPQASRNSSSARVFLVSAQEKSEGPSLETPAAETPAAEPAETKPAEAPPADKPAEEKPAAETPAGEKPAEEKPADEKPAGEAAAPETKPAEEVKYEPLEKVADTIRTNLAREKAGKQLTEQFEELSAAMRRYSDELDIYETEKQTNPSLKPPTALNFAELAKGKDVQPLELKSVTAAEAAKEGIGKSYKFGANARSRQFTTIPFVDFAFNDSLAPYRVETVQDNDSNAYLFWKTDEEPAFVPPLDQVRDKVVLAWKLIKARDLARKRAEEYAQQATALKKPLAELPGKPADSKVIDTPAFSWMTIGNVPNNPGAPPTLSEVEGLDRVGEEFMKSVFSLEPGAVGVASNYPQDTVYVVRAAEFEPPVEELREDFARENPGRYLGAAMSELRPVYQAWLADVNKQAKVHWMREADVRRQPAEEAAEE